MPLAQLAAADAAAAAATAATGPGGKASRTPAAAATGPTEMSLDEQEAAAVAFWDELYGRDGLDDAAAGAAECAVPRMELVSYGGCMGGLPAAGEMLAPGVYAVGDSAAGGYRALP